MSKIGIYRKNTGQLRAFPFDVRGMSLVVGRAARGKSALLDIVNYCFLSRHCPIAKGVIRDHVSHVGVLFEGEDTKCVVVRALPGPDRLTVENLYLAVGKDIDLPETPPTLEWNLDTAREEFSEFVGIEAVPAISRAGKYEPDGAANIRHCVPFLLQPQDVIASRQILFPGIDDSFKKRNVAEALFYFLGILTRESVAKRLELRDKRIELARIRRALAEGDALRASGYERGLVLLNEARSTGISDSPDPESLSELLGGLHRIASYKRPTDELPPEPVDVPSAQAREAALRERQRKVRENIAELQRYTAMDEDRARIAGTQRARLSLRELLPMPSGRKCPLCDNGSVDAQHIVAEMAAAISSVADTVAIPRRLRSRLETEIAALRVELATVEPQLRSAQQTLRAALRGSETRSTTAEVSGRIERLVGRISEYVRSMKPPDDTLLDRFRELQREIAQLEEQVDAKSLRAKRTEISDKLTERMAELSRRVDVEFPDHAVQLDLDELGVKIDFDGAWVPLNELGSAGNYIGYHLISVVALHEHFIKVGAPVPQLLMLDQPSQAWFPGDIGDNAKQQRGGKDFESVSRVFRFLRGLSHLPQAPQVIVVDHAWYEEDGFVPQYDWRGDDGLVPAEWRGPS